MFTTLLTIALFAALTVPGAFADFTVNAAELIQCQPSKVTWSATSGPYLLTVVSAADPCGNALVDLGDHNYTSMTYTVALAAGTEVQLVLEDAVGDEAWTGNLTVASSGNTSCLPQSGSTSSGSTLVVTPTTISMATTSPVGAAGNAGANPVTSGAIIVCQASMPILVLAAFATVVVASL